jgi:anti-sigma factor RsiW
MTWTCEQIESRLSDHLDGLMAPAEAREFKQHVDSCENCTQLVASVSGAVGSLHSLEALEAPPSLVYAILNQTLGPRAARKGWRSIFGWFKGITTLRFVYSAAALVTTVLILTLSSSRKPKLADFTPVNIYRSANSQAHLAYARSVKFVSDLRVVYEIQSRLSKDNELPTEQEGTVPQPTPGKNPGSTDSTKPATPRQQNRANGIGRGAEILAEELPAITSGFCTHLLPRRIP